jgi:hypothetical protein
MDREMNGSPNKNGFRLLLVLGLGFMILSLWLGIVAFLGPSLSGDKPVVIQLYVADLLGMLVILKFVLTRVQHREGYSGTGVRSVIVELISTKDPVWISWVMKALLAYTLILGLVSLRFGIFGRTGDKALYETWGIRTIAAVLLLFNFWNLKSVWGILSVKDYA